MSSFLVAPRPPGLRCAHRFRVSAQIAPAGGSTEARPSRPTAARRFPEPRAALEARPALSSGGAVGSGGAEESGGAGGTGDVSSTGGGSSFTGGALRPAGGGCRRRGSGRVRRHRRRDEYGREPEATSTAALASRRRDERFRDGRCFGSLGWYGRHARHGWYGRRVRRPVRRIAISGCVSDSPQVGCAAASCTPCSLRHER